jgi:hypothetical protein
MHSLDTQLRWFRTGFYQRAYRLCIRWVAFFAVLNILLIGIIFYQLITMGKPSFYASAANGRVSPLRGYYRPMFLHNWKRKGGQ